MAKHKVLSIIPFNEVGRSALDNYLNGDGTFSPDSKFRDLTEEQVDSCEIVTIALTELNIYPEEISQERDTYLIGLIR